jgi:rod shape-determining protein MreC
MPNIWKRYLVPSIAVLILVWVFSRPLSFLGLFLYDFSGKYLNSLYKNIIQTQKEASDLLQSQERIKELELINRNLRVENTKLSALTQELETLNQKLDFKNSFIYETISAQVTGRSPDHWHKQLIIDKGSDNGILVGKGVFTEKGIIGQVVKTWKTASLVQLIFNRDWKMGAKIQRINKYGVISGNYPGPGYLEFITVDTEVELGDEIVSSGICLSPTNCPYPENFPVGIVTEVRRDPQIVDLIVKVKFYEDLSDIKEVFVLK